MKRLWRCLNCPGEETRYLEFVAEIGEHQKGICPKCSAGESIRTAKKIRPLKVVHFEPMTKVRGVGSHKLACTGEPPKPGQIRTGAIEAVNCPKCKESQFFKEAKAASLADPAYEVPSDGVEEKPKPKAKERKPESKEQTPSGT